VQSGLVVPGDAKALAVIDLNGDGWPDFLVTRNDRSTLAFENQGAAGRRSFGVKLRGPAGNPTAVGARIMVEFSDDSRQVGEVQAGSGHMSQSAATCFFGSALTVKPRVIRVRWPSGAITDHAPSNAPIIVIAQP
jgi:enediyne biosynthesis protein E4